MNDSKFIVHHKNGKKREIDANNLFECIVKATTSSIEEEEDYSIEKIEYLGEELHEYNDVSLTVNWKRKY